MTENQKQCIKTMRRAGCGYARIAEEIGLPLSTVKTFCHRNRLQMREKNTCKHCGQPLEHSPGAKPKLFCGDTCRWAWWNANRQSAVRPGGV